MQSSITHFFCLTVGLIMVAGCDASGKRPADMPKLYPTTITITQADAPLADAMVNMRLADGSQSKWYSGGATDVNGVVTILTQGGSPGAPAGKYKVLVTKVTSEPNPRDPELSLTFSLVEPQYADFARTPLEIEIKAEPANSFTLDVGPAYKMEAR